MAMAPSVQEQELLADTFQRAGTRMNRRELQAELFSLLGFAAAIAAVWTLRPPQSVEVIPATLCWVVLVVAMTVRFETPFGFTVPTQLAFVPLLFAVPLSLVPIFVAVAMVTARLPDVFKGETDAARLL